MISGQAQDLGVFRLVVKLRQGVRELHFHLEPRL